MKNTTKLTSIILLLWLILPSGQSFAQDIEVILEQKYEQALLDTAIRYELLKPVVYNLQKSYEHLNQENFTLRAEKSLMQLQFSMQKEHYEKLLADERKKRGKGNVKAFIAGFVTGKLTPPY